MSRPADGPQEKPLTAHKRTLYEQLSPGGVYPETGAGRLLPRAAVVVSRWGRVGSAGLRKIWR